MHSEMLNKLQSDRETAMTASADVLADLRAGIARRLVPHYKLAAQIQLHPGRMGMMLRGSLPMPVEIAERISEALTRMAASSAA
jgi:hypothetical protein